MKTHVDPNIFLTYRAKDIQTKMSSNPTCIEIDDEPEIALEKLDSHDFDQAPVVSDRTVIGWIVKRAESRPPSREMLSSSKPRRFDK